MATLHWNEKERYFEGLRSVEISGFDITKWPAAPIAYRALNFGFERRVGVFFILIVLREDGYEMSIHLGAETGGRMFLRRGGDGDSLTKAVDEAECMMKQVAEEMRALSGPSPNYHIAPGGASIPETA